MSRLLVFFALLCELIGWCAAPLRAQPLPDRFPLRGLVVDGDGKPLPRVFLSLRRQNTEGSFAFWGAEASSDAGGGFVFSGVEEGNYYLNGELEGYASALNRPVALKRGAGPIRIQLNRLATARFRLLSPDGKPWTSQLVWLRLVGVEGEAIARRETSDLRGSVVLTGLVAGTYNLWAHTASGYASQRVELRDSSSGASIEVRLQNGASLRVVARNSGGEALGGALLTLHPASADEATRLGSVGGDTNDEYTFFAADGDSAQIVTRDGDGLLELHHLPPGRYSAQLVSAGHPSIAPRVLEVEEGQSLDQEWTFLERHAGSLTLDLRTPNDKPIANREVTVRVVPINTSGIIERESVDETGAAVPFFPFGTGLRRAISDASGRLRLFPVRPGRYRVFVAPRAATSGEAPLKESSPLDLDVAQSGATSTVIIP